MELYLNINSCFRNADWATEGKGSHSINVVCNPKASLNQLFSERVDISVIVFSTTVVAKVDAVTDCHPGYFP